MANIRDVARQAGVSIATVSAALNRSDRSARRPRRVWEVAAAVDAPNAIARSLRLGKAADRRGRRHHQRSGPRRCGWSRTRQSGRLFDHPSKIATTRSAARHPRPAPRPACCRHPLDADGRSAGYVQRSAGATRRRGRDGSARAGSGARFRRGRQRAAGAHADEFRSAGHRRIASDRGGGHGRRTTLAGFVETMTAAGVPVDPALCLRSGYRGESAYATVPLLTRPTDRHHRLQQRHCARGAAGDKPIGFRCPGRIAHRHRRRAVGKPGARASPR